MAELFYRKLTGLPGDESPVVMVTTGGSGGGVVGMRLVVWGWEAPPPGTFSKSSYAVWKGVHSSK